MVQVAVVFSFFQILNKCLELIKFFIYLYLFPVLITSEGNEEIRLAFLLDHGHRVLELLSVVGSRADEVAGHSRAHSHLATSTAIIQALLQRLQEFLPKRN